MNIKIKILNKMSQNEVHCVYMLYSPTMKRTYVGYTINVYKRIRQHNGEITGGAKTTMKGRPWKLIFFIEGFPDQIEALRFEWRCHHPHRFLSKNKRPIRGHGYEGRIKSMCSILEMEKVTSKAKENKEMNLKIIWVCEHEKPQEIIQAEEFLKEKLII